MIIEGSEGFWKAERVVSLLFSEAHDSICKCGGL